MNEIIGNPVVYRLPKIATVVESDGDTTFYWSMVSSNWELEEGQALYHSSSTGLHYEVID